MEGEDGETPAPTVEEDEEAGPGPASDDFFAATPGLRRFLTGLGLAGMAVAVADAAVSGASLVAGTALALSAGLVWTVWRGRLPTRYRVGWLAWIVAAGAAVAWPGRPGLLAPALAGLALGAMVPTVRAARRPG